MRSMWADILRMVPAVTVNAARNNKGIRKLAKAIRAAFPSAVFIESEYGNILSVAFRANDGERRGYNLAGYNPRGQHYAFGIDEFYIFADMANAFFDKHGGEAGGLGGVTVEPIPFQALIEIRARQYHREMREIVTDHKGSMVLDERINNWGRPSFAMARNRLLWGGLNSLSEK